ncbi:glyceraldehyde-3-phosphate ketol-isomerase [Klebsiella pneumoniae]|uniref:Glyceraldehyde-3-phosphate ketol-isomerase n=1 Tax=Klebsiella pneumoniae TaxID=573 RepID=A0A377XJ27_KLEPN|nr:glyceraldehyde-3-phosphate ketol-isomerase [Klebsiella pneumoniae]
MKIAFDVDVIKDLGITRMVHQVAEWGYKYIEQSPHPQINPFYKHPRASREIMAEYSRRCAIPALSCRRLSASTAGPARTNCAVRRR